MTRRSLRSLLLLFALTALPFAVQAQDDLAHDHSQNFAEFHPGVVEPTERRGKLHDGRRIHSSII